MKIENIFFIILKFCIIPKILFRRLFGVCQIFIFPRKARNIGRLARADKKLVFFLSYVANYTLFKFVSFHNHFFVSIADKPPKRLARVSCLVMLYIFKAFFLVLFNDFFNGGNEFFKTSII